MNDCRGLWRGKTLLKTNPEEAFNNVWVQGDLIEANGKKYIHPKTNDVKVSDTDLGKFIVMHEVIPKTLGECTGLIDKNGKLIFEGDILKYYDDKNDSGLVCFGDYGFYHLNVNHMGFYVLRNTRERGIYWDCPDHSLKCAEIIGNIHDNPKLVHGKNGESNG